MLELFCRLVYGLYLFCLLNIWCILVWIKNVICVDVLMMEFNGYIDCYNYFVDLMFIDDIYNVVDNVRGVGVVVVLVCVEILLDILKVLCLCEMFFDILLFCLGIYLV